MSIPIALLVLAIGAAAVLRAIFHRDSGEAAADILVLLWAQDRPISQSDICGNRKMRTQDVVTGLARLEELGLVRREWDNDTGADLFRAVTQGGRGVRA
jgi:DNA-binding MarR family transcriptional regulator